ncbi:carboxypeptidase-like regulatory domain-containing protein [Allomuricauda sp. SCSIO 65647]|uniref:carboxypeptidase-like regulatory domain-containing protein n=1 Tax=Allomuricauda sp. SCSIO 65647 TaxID=2908843 RepID=UPI001F1B9BEE|nr:carboxypeptidase-like regulatory domain-containing protein [Muricauda sp. SCSIO 65647]UJH68617.1 carboxypeptidase-like regulatory domain-containing protein [Muricauda sp. SCSIO 65647]
MKTKIIILVFFILPSSMLLGQHGVLSGTLLDNNGLPIPGASITVKGKNIGTQTDFDGNYSLNCEVGDVLIFTYIGFASKEVKVTSKMFGGNEKTQITKNIAVKPIVNDAYVNRLNQSDNPDFQIPDIDGSNQTYSLNQRYFDSSRIKQIEKGKDNIKVKIYPEDIYFEIGFTQKSSLQFVQRKNLPALQNQFAQGRPANGTFTWFGPETNELFSFGPRLANLEYDGQPYPFDINGQLVNLGDGSGINAQPYEESIFQTGLNTFNALDFIIHSDQHQLTFNYTNSNFKDLFNKSGSKTNAIDLNYTNKGEILHWDTSIQYNNSKVGNANINAFHNQIYLGHLITPPSFSNGQGFFLDDGSQRSFSPQNFNNPNWLLERNRNEFKYSFFKANLKNKINVIDGLNLETGLAFTKQSEDLFFGLPINTNGFIDGYQSLKTIDSEEISLDLSASYSNIFISDDIYFYPYSSISYNNSRLDYGLLEESPVQELNSLNAEPNKSTVQLKNRLLFEAYFDVEVNLSLQNNSFSSTIQGSRWFLPSAKAYLKLGNDIFNYSSFLSSISISGGISKDVVDFPLYYDNLSHNSLQLTIDESLGYTTNNDLFTSSDLDFEEVTQFDVETKIALFDNRVNLAASYYNSRHKNSIFPVFENTSWQLRNIAEIKNKGFEATLQFYLNQYYDSKFKLDTKFIFSINRPTVEAIYDESLDRIPISGFQGISKNLIVGQPAGVVVGTAFLRNGNNEIVVGNDGFPLVNPEPQILGNTIPDFNLGWSNTLNFNQFTLSFLLDYQKGGEIWNGTQNTLNYFGTSQETAALRSTTDFIFQGIDESGNVNSTPVDFASPTADVTQNRWVRYGFGGIAEEAISDGSYLNLKSIALSYKIKNDSKNVLFKEIDLGIFAKNIWNWTKTRGANPYSSLFGNASSDGLHFFNLPLASEVGLTINIKI